MLQTRTALKRKVPRARFSLYELMIVVAVLGLLGALALPLMIKSRVSPQTSRTQAKTAGDRV